MRQTTEALAALHRAGFVHGDVKPDNVRLVDDGTAVLIDLGFAHRPGENDALLREGYVLGTANYLAPELCRPKPHSDTSGDLFSLGVTLFEMLTGRLPYPPGTLGQTFRRHGCDPPTDVRRCGVPVPRELAQLVMRLLVRHPEERPKAAAVVRQLIALEIAALRRALARPTKCRRRELHPVVGVEHLRLTPVQRLLQHLPAHDPHQPLHPLAVDRLATLGEPLRPAPTAEERVGRVLFIDRPQVLVRLGGRLVVQFGAAQPQQFALPPHAQRRVVHLDQKPQLLR